MSVKIDDFWDSNYYNNPPVTDEMVKKAERILGVKLPDTFIELLRQQNGGYTKGFAFPMKKKTTWADDHVPLNELFGIVVNKNSDSGHNILQTDYMIKEWGLPEKLVLLTGDGHWWITLDYRKESVPTVRWIDIECGEDVHIANNFEEFINGLVSEGEFYNE